MPPAIAVRPLTLDDVPYGLTLSTAAKWNQTTRDWRRVVEWQPDGCFVGVVDGRDAGTITTCQFGPVAWIGLLLVDADNRGRGLGRALLEYALQWLDAHGSTTIRLDATPLGQPLYERLGLTADFELLRFAGHPSRTAALQDARGAVSVRPMTIDDRAEVVRLDEHQHGLACDSGRAARRQASRRRRE